MTNLAFEAKVRARQASHAHFQQLCREAHVLLTAAAQHATATQLGDVHVKKAEAAAALAGAMFHTIIGQADAVDMNRLHDDLELIARRIDPLIAAIGEEARKNTPGAPSGEFDDCFKDVITNAIEGNATFLLSQCAENCAAAINDPDAAAKHRRELQHAE